MPIEDQLRALAGAATPGPYYAKWHQRVTTIPDCDGTSSLLHIYTAGTTDQKYFAALPPETITALCDVVAAARAMWWPATVKQNDALLDALLDALAALDALDGTTDA